MTTFADAVYRIVEEIPQGRVMTYQTVALALGNPRAVRAVGNALHHNPTIIIVPCHRVVRSDGRVGGYAGGVGRKVALLRNEGVEVRAGKVDLKQYGYTYKKSKKQK